MKVLLINNFHYLRGGAERCYFDTAAILSERGHDVAFFSTADPKNVPTEWAEYFVEGRDLGKRYGSVGNLKIAARILYNFEAKRKLSRLIDEFNPDIAHLHNIHHHLSPSIIHPLKKRKIPVVMTLHDYKLVSPNYNLYANGKNYEKALGGKYYRCIMDKCVQNSYAASAVCVLEAYLHAWLGLYRRIDAYISPSLFLKNKFRQAGFTGDIVYLPNPYYQEDIANGMKPGVKQDKYILYFGRLSDEKGVADLIEAYSAVTAEVKLLITGTGPQEAILRQMAEKNRMGRKIEFTGYKQGQDLADTIKNALFVVMPSRWQENAPYCLIEAMALTKCVLCARMGGFTDFIEDGVNGLYYEPGNAKDLGEKLNFLINSPKLEEIGQNARQLVVKLNSKDKYYQGLINLYKKL